MTIRAEEAILRIRFDTASSFASPGIFEHDALGQLPRGITFREGVAYQKAS
jgi:hypothetical protein